MNENYLQNVGSQHIAKTNYLNMNLYLAQNHVYLHILALINSDQIEFLFCDSFCTTLFIFKVLTLKSIHSSERYSINIITSKYIRTLLPQPYLFILFQMQKLFTLHGSPLNLNICVCLPRVYIILFYYIEN